jgi:hypothetical protein
LLQSHVINDEQVGFEVTAQQPVAFGEGLFRKKVGDQIEDGAIADGKSLLDGFVTDGLGEVGLADSGRTDEQHIGGLADEVAGGQFVDVFTRNRRVEPPVKVIEVLECLELGREGATGELALLSDIDLVEKNQFEELAMRKPVGRGLLQSYREGLSQRGEAQLFESGIEVHAWEKAARP